MRYMDLLSVKNINQLMNNVISSIVNDCCVSHVVNTFDRGRLDYYAQKYISFVKSNSPDGYFLGTYVQYKAFDRVLVNINKIITLMYTRFVEIYLYLPSHYKQFEHKT